MQLSALSECPQRLSAKLIFPSQIEFTKNIFDLREFPLLVQFAQQSMIAS